MQKFTSPAFMRLSEVGTAEDELGISICHGRRAKHLNLGGKESRTFAHKYVVGGLGTSLRQARCARLFGKSLSDRTQMYIPLAADLHLMLFTVALLPLTPPPQIPPSLMGSN